MHLKVLITLFQKIIWFIAVWATIHEILAIKISKKMPTPQKFNKILRLQTLNISELANHSIINNTIFWKCVTRPFRYIYVTCRVRVLPEVSTKLQKMHFFRQFKDHNSGREHGNYTNDPILFIYFFRSDCLYCSFLNLKILKINFYVVPHLVHSGLKNTTIFGQKLLIRTAHHTFLEGRHPEVTKNLYYVLSIRRSQIPIFLGTSSWTIWNICFLFCALKLHEF